MLDYLIKGAHIVDGTGAPPENGDLGIRDGKIVARGRVDEEARETIAADGALATPGWVDIHTHYDGQVTWDDQMDPSACPRCDHRGDGQLRGRVCPRAPGRRA